MRNKIFLGAVLALILVGQLGAHGAAESAGPSPLIAPAFKGIEVKGLKYAKPYFPGAIYDSSIPTQESLIGFPAGQRAATAEQIEQCLKAWSAKSNRTRLQEYARTDENRPLYYMIITSPKNLARLDDIRSGMARLADPRGLGEAEAQTLIDSLPPVAWLAYTIHGDETEGSDAALALLYHLIAATDAKTEKLLEDLVIIIDPLQNPDGRDRFVKMVAENRGAWPNVDDLSLVHQGYWPWGRGNHYLFDLNRDWILGTQPETRGRIREIARWNPLLAVDAHGMGSQGTHLFSPPREPINLHFPQDHGRWADVFAQDQAKAFDRLGWLYYHGEWNEGWYPGYGDAWAGFRGAVDILYEQARVAEDGVRRPGGQILSYAESVHHHIVGSMANLTTLQSHAKALLRRFLAVRRAAVDKNGPYSRRTFAILPTANHSRWQAFVNLMRLQGFELYTLTNEFIAPLATDQLGREFRQKSLPAGTLLLPNRQPLAHLLATLLEFDPKLPTVALEDERRSLLRNGQTRIYDTTAWNLTMLLGLEALTLPIEMPDSSQRLAPAEPPANRISGKTSNPVAYVINGADDLSATAAARLMEAGLELRVAEKPFQFDQQSFPRGSVVVTVSDNEFHPGDLRNALTKTLAELKLTATAIGTGLGLGDLPNLGGEHFTRLERPRIALLARSGFAGDEVGSLSFILDYQLGVGHSDLQIAEGRGALDLERYNVLLLPSRGGPLAPALMQDLKNWVRAGGTLIAIGSSAAQLAAEKSEFSGVRILPDVLAKLTDYEQAIFREWAARRGELPATDQIWAYKASANLSYPWSGGDAPFPDEKELKRRDAWQALFMPQGAFVAARTDDKHWLTFGVGEMLPLLARHQPILMAAEGIETPIRYGYFVPADKKTAPAAASRAESAEGKKKEAARVGWSALPEGFELQLRMSGLLWPEAAHRLANSAYLTRESIGRGQVILFASSPTFRAATLGATRLLLNAIVYGPGFGAAPRIRP